jgi:hypothetical protein
MTKLSGFFDPRGARGTQGVPPRLQYLDATASYSFVIGDRDLASGKYIPRHATVPLGTKVALDFGAIEWGWLQFRPFDDQFLVPLCHPIPPQPEGDYTRAVRLPALLEKYGLAQWTAAGIITQNALFSVHVIFQRSAEAAQGQIPIVALRPSRQISIASRNGEVHTSPVLELVGWADRKDEVFGPRLVPPPIAVIAQDAPSVRIEHTGDASGVPTVSTASNNVNGMTTATGNTASAVPAANDDVFTTMTPMVTAAVTKANPPLF